LAQLNEVEFFHSLGQLAGGQRVPFDLVHDVSDLRSSIPHTFVSPGLRTTLTGIAQKDTT
jgi:hypothetical protein